MAAVQAPPAFELESTRSGRVTLDALRADGPVLLVVVEPDCPTCAIALRRLGEVDAPVVVICEDEADGAARLARRCGFAGTVLAQPAPFETSRAFAVETVPTAILLGPDGAEQDRVVGWQRSGFQRLLERAATASARTAPALSDATPTEKPGCASRSTYDAAMLAALAGDAAGSDALEEMWERGWTDGLPVVPPTPERVERMLGGRDPGRSLGEVPPALGEATLARVAACAVLAGCRPAYFPVVVAAVEAALDPSFNLNGQAVTTSPPGQVVIVNGPVRHELGLHSGMGALGPGTRANATIGRALRLVVTLTGGARPGTLDRATLGHPGKIGFCLAEDEEGSPWAPLHVERGFSAGASTVTLLAGDAPLSISDHRSRTPEALAATLAWAAAATWSPNWWPMDATSLFVICPEHAALFRDHGWTKERLREAIFAAPRRRASELRAFGETTPEVHAAADGAEFGKWTDPERVQLVVAGGEAGRFSAVIGPSLGMGAALVSREVEWTT